MIVSQIYPVFKDSLLLRSLLLLSNESGPPPLSPLIGEKKGGPFWDGLEHTPQMWRGQKKKKKKKKKKLNHNLFIF
jgi:uncharacterized protein (DUF2249 family)